MIGCPLIRKVWQDLESWIGMPSRTSYQLYDSLLSWHKGSDRKRIKRSKRSLIWLTSVWVICSKRNHIIFSEGAFILFDLVWEIKLKVWKSLLLGEISYSKCNCYDFYKDPVSFLTYMSFGREFLCFGFSGFYRCL